MSLTEELGILVLLSSFCPVSTSARRPSASVFPPHAGPAIKHCFIKKTFELNVAKSCQIL